MTTDRQQRRRVRSVPQVVGAGLAMAVLLSLLGATPAPAALARSAGSASTSGSIRVVRYHGYEIRVPARWPVYRLATGGSRCVLFNRHAVYLGTPGADQRCPARAFGHTEAILVQPLGPLSQLPPGTVVLPRGTAALPAGARALPAAAAAEAATGHVLQVAVPSSGVLVTATYGNDQSLVRAILAGAMLTRAAAHHAAPRAAQRVTHAKPALATPARPHPAQQQRARPQQALLSGQPGSGLGFDTCTAPATATMTAWLASPYRVTGTYLGGVNWACTYGNFSAAWVSQVAALGWQLIPIWVGLQAPCSNSSGVATIKSAQAATEGKAEAASAVTAAQHFGYSSGSPIYFNMEGYDNSIASCKRAVLTFLGAWTTGLHAAGYLSGVYSTASSGISDLASRYGTASYPRPDDIWIADWSGDPVLTDSYVPAGDWPGHRLHQYYGDHNETWGGATVNVDNDVIGGTVAGLPGTGNTPRPAIVGQPDAVRAAPGKTATVQLTIRGTAQAQATVSWHVNAPAGVTVTPSQGVTTVPPGGSQTVTLAVTLSASLPAGRYDVPVTATASKRPITETFELVSAVQPRAALPTRYPIVLYAADSTSMATAVAVAQRLALPAGDVTGTFDTAWADLTGGSDLVLAVGQAADNALFFNPCGWPNPAGTGAGSTPFSYPGLPLQRPPGADLYEPSNGSSAATTAQLTAQLTHYALAGTLPGEGAPPAGISLPANTCLGSPGVPVP